MASNLFYSFWHSDPLSTKGTTSDHLWKPSPVEMPFPGYYLGSAAQGKGGKRIPHADTSLSINEHPGSWNPKI